MSRLVLLSELLALGVLLLGSQFPKVLKQAPKQATELPIKDVEQDDWQWRPAKGQLLAALTPLNDRYQIDVVLPKGQWGASLSVRIGDHAKEIYQFKGHSGTAAETFGSLVIFTDYEPGRSGCSLVAYDLKEGKEAWRTKLEGLGHVIHSKYSNSVSMRRKGGMLIVYGSESAGRYIEMVQITNGRIIGNKVLPEEN
jgi:hypothetical protein